MVLYQGPYTEIPSIVSLAIFELFHIMCVESQSPLGGIVGCFLGSELNLHPISNSIWSSSNVGLHCFLNLSFKHYFTQV